VACHARTRRNGGKKSEEEEKVRHTRYVFSVLAQTGTLAGQQTTAALVQQNGHRNETLSSSPQTKPGTLADVG
jgi:hypothetical protein